MAQALTSSGTSGKVQGCQVSWFFLLRMGEMVHFQDLQDSSKISSKSASYSALRDSKMQCFVSVYITVDF